MHASQSSCFWTVTPVWWLTAVGACLCCLQDLCLILQLLSALLKQEPLLAKPLLEVSIIYTNNQRMDWLDVIVASLNVLPGLAMTASAAAAASGTAAVTAAATGMLPPYTGNSSSSNSSSSLCKAVLCALGDCLVAAAAAARCQPGRVVAALGSCQLFAGVALAPEPLPMVGLEGLASWAHAQQQAEQAMGAIEDWRTLEALQVRAGGRCLSQLGAGTPQVSVRDCCAQLHHVLGVHGGSYIPRVHGAHCNGAEKKAM